MGNIVFIYFVDVGNVVIIKVFIEVMNFYDIWVIDKVNNNGEIFLIRVMKFKWDDCKEVLLNDGKVFFLVCDFDLKLNVKEWERYLKDMGEDEIKFIEDKVKRVCYRE